MLQTVIKQAMIILKMKAILRRIGIGVYTH